MYVGGEGLCPTIVIDPSKCSAEETNSIKSNFTKQCEAYATLEERTATSRDIELFMDETQYSPLPFCLVST